MLNSQEIDEQLKYILGLPYENGTLKTLNNHELSSKNLIMTAAAADIEAGDEVNE